MNLEELQERQLKPNETFLPEAPANATKGEVLALIEHVVRLRDLVIQDMMHRDEIVKEIDSL